MGVWRRRWSGRRLGLLWALMGGWISNYCLMLAWAYKQAAYEQMWWGRTRTHGHAHTRIKEVPTGLEPLTLESPSGIPLRFCGGALGPPAKLQGHWGGRFHLLYESQVA